MTTVTLEFNMAEITTIRNAITTKLIYTEDSKRRCKKAIGSIETLTATKCELYDDLRGFNNTLSQLRNLEHKIDAFVCNQTGEDM